MKYTVIEAFVDLQDCNHVYQAGDEFPRNGADVSFDRIAELASNKNMLGMPLIAEAKGKKKVDEVENAPAKEEVVDADEDVKPLTEEDIDGMPYFSLKKEAKMRGIDIEGKKSAELREELKASL